MSGTISQLLATGKSNYADYWTKHHLVKHHQNIRREFLTPHIVIEMLQQEREHAIHAVQQHKQK